MIRRHYLDSGTTPAAAATVQYVSINQERPCYSKVRIDHLHSISGVLANAGGKPDPLGAY